MTSDPQLWTTQGTSLLFLFYLHGFVALAHYAAGPRTSTEDGIWERLVVDWLAQHRVPAHPAWHPYPTSLRIVAWCSALGSIRRWPEQLRRDLAGEIRRQARYLRRAVEHDIGGNHVLLNAKALVFAGVTLGEGAIQSAGLRLLRSELRRQLLADGGHEERSTSYHREIAENLADVAELLRRAGEAPPSWLLMAQRRMEAWMLALRGPDGCLPLFNDAWEGPPLLDAGPSEPITVLQETGFVVLRDGPHQLIFDCGPLCPPHLPPHAHADALSFVAWFDGRPLLVDPGAYTYTGPDRNTFRGTGAHNTLQVDDADQCVYWGDFRAGLLPTVGGPWVRQQDGIVIVEGLHDGYRRLPDGVQHHRALLWLGGNGVVVLDRLAGRGRHSVRSSLTFHPAADALAGGPGSAGFSLQTLGPQQHTLRERARYAPYIGTAEGCTRCIATSELGVGSATGWSLLRGGTDVHLAADDAVEITVGGVARRVHLRPA